MDHKSSDALFRRKTISQGVIFPLHFKLKPENWVWNGPNKSAIGWTGHFLHFFSSKLTLEISNLARATPNTSEIFSRGDNGWITSLIYNWFLDASWCLDCTCGVPDLEEMQLTKCVYESEECKRSTSDAAWKVPKKFIQKPGQFQLQLHKQ